MKDDSLFWDKKAVGYSKKPVPDQTLYEMKLDKTRKLLSPKMKILEIGCGTGTTILKHAPYVEKAVASDFSQEMISIAKQKSKSMRVLKTSNLRWSLLKIWIIRLKVST